MVYSVILLQIPTSCQVSGSSAKLALRQYSSSSCLSVGSWLRGLTLSAGSAAGWLWLGVSAARFSFWFCTTVLLKLSLTMLHMRILVSVTRCTASSTVVHRRSSPAAHRLLARLGDSIPVRRRRRQRLEIFATNRWRRDETESADVFLRRRRWKYVTELKHRKV